MFPLDWAIFTTTFSHYSLATSEMKFVENEAGYDIWFLLGGRVLSAYVPKTDPANADQIDFETNYKV